MPQLWKTGRPAAPTPASNQPAKGFLICPPLVLGNGGEPSGNGCFPSSPPSSPSSPTGHQHPPKYDQLLNELRRAQVKTKEFVLCFLYFARNGIRTIQTAKRKGGGRVIAFYRSSRATTTKKKGVSLLLIISSSTCPLMIRHYANEILNPFGGYLTDLRPVRISLFGRMIRNGGVACKRAVKPMRYRRAPSNRRLRRF